MSRLDGAQARPGWRWHQPWMSLAMFSLLLNLPWELLAMSSYILPPRPENTTRFPVDCIQASLGDVVITLVSFAVASLVARRQWLSTPSRLAIATYLGAGLGATVVLEYVNVDLLRRWAYAPGMPTIAGIGTLPLAQWILLPPIVLWLARRHLASNPPHDDDPAAAGT